MRLLLLRVQSGLEPWHTDARTLMQAQHYDDVAQVE